MHHAQKRRHSGSHEKSTGGGGQEHYFPWRKFLMSRFVCGVSVGCARCSSVRQITVYSLLHDIHAPLCVCLYIRTHTCLVRLSRVAAWPRYIRCAKNVKDVNLVRVAVHTKNQDPDAPVLALFAVRDIKQGTELLRSR